MQASNAPNIEVETQYQHAIDTARQQQARSLELRATTSLCKLWQKQGKLKQAHHRLNAIYSWFSEGFETGDLQEAQILLVCLETAMAN